MIDGVYVFTKGGVILWSYEATKHMSKTLSATLNGVVKSVFLQEKASTHSKCNALIVDNIHVCYHHLNQIQSIIVCFFSGNTENLYANQVLKQFAHHFEGMVNDLHGYRSAAIAGCKGDSEETTRQTVLWLTLKNSRCTQLLSQRYKDVVEQLDSKWDSRAVQAVPDESSKLKFQTQAPRVMQETKPKKTPTTWGTQKVTKKAMTTLDLSAKDNEESKSYAPSTSLPLRESMGSFSSALSSDSDQCDQDTDTNRVTHFFSRIKDSVQQSFTGNKILTKQDLTQVLEEMQIQLLEKNVASGMVDQLIASVEASLIGTKTSSFQSVRAAVYEAFRNALNHIFSNKCTRDVLKEIFQAQNNKQGVNGVGKSTSLAKVAYYLKHKGNFNVMVAACDTFRAGAVEQLKTHTRNLGLHLFEQGYGKDAALLCKASLKYAQTHGYDVVLIDTAGRMQDNEPLMRSLAKLVALNNPDLVLFVGEALVGNDATHQLTRFNQCLVDYAPVNIERPRGIDAIFLSKFDTVDSKVGAVLSLTYVSECPLAFIGTGQRYTDIQKLKVNTVVNILLNDK